MDILSIIPPYTNITSSISYLSKQSLVDSFYILNQTLSTPLTHVLNAKTHFDEGHVLWALTIIFLLQMLATIVHTIFFGYDRIPVRGKVSD